MKKEERRFDEISEERGRKREKEREKEEKRRKLSREERVMEWKKKSKGSFIQFSTQFEILLYKLII
jgi:hypothetical protein